MQVKHVQGRYLRLRHAAAGYRLQVEVNEQTGQVTVTGANSVIVHFLGMRDDDGMLFQPALFAQHENVSVHCRVTEDNRSISAQVFVGPVPAWDQEQCPGLTVHCLPTAAEHVVQVYACAPASAGEQTRLLMAEPWPAPPTQAC